MYRNNRDNRDNKDYKEFVEKRDKKIVTLLKKGESCSSVAKKFGVSSGTVNLIKSKNGIKIKTKRTNYKSMKVLSPFHQYIGNTIQVKRIEKFLSLRDFAKEIGISYRKLSLIELGFCDFTISELNQIANRLELEINIHLLGNKDAGKLQSENISISSSSFSYEPR